MTKVRRSWFRKKPVRVALSMHPVSHETSYHASSGFSRNQLRAHRWLVT